MIIATLIMTGVKVNYNISDKEIIERAKELDMVFPNEIKAIYWEDEVND